MEQTHWHGRPYYSFDAYLKNTYGRKLYKLAIDAGFTCPNRDGTIGVGGCIFCSAGGSGEYAVKRSDYPSVKEQLAAGAALLDRKLINDLTVEDGRRFIAYFQAYTNTYGPLPRLRALYAEALENSSVAGISIATRPDCISEELIAMLLDLRTEFTDKFIWIELGLQTIHDTTADFIRRGYPLSVYDRCASLLQSAQIPFITHVILGLPHETREHMLSTIDYMNHSGTWGVKLQLLHVLRGTGLATLYEQGDYVPLSADAYTGLVIDCLERLSPDIVIHRLTGDGPRALLLAPLWSLDKRSVLNTLHHTMKLCGARQGRRIEDRKGRP